MYHMHRPQTTPSLRIGSVLGRSSLHPCRCHAWFYIAATVAGWRPRAPKLSAYAGYTVRYDRLQAEAILG
jgi:hypothetical protein